MPSPTTPSRKPPAGMGAKRASGGTLHDLEGWAQVYADNHRAEGMGCSCGFCVWSVEHVLVMSIREAWAELVRRGEVAA